MFLVRLFSRRHGVWRQQCRHLHQRLYLPGRRSTTQKVPYDTHVYPAFILDEVKGSDAYHCDVKMRGDIILQRFGELVCTTSNKSIKSRISFY